MMTGRGDAGGGGKGDDDDGRAMTTTAARATMPAVTMPAAAARAMMMTGRGDAGGGGKGDDDDGRGDDDGGKGDDAGGDDAGGGGKDDDDDGRAMTTTAARATMMTGRGDDDDGGKGDDAGGGGKGGRADPACMLTLVTTDDITVPAGGSDTSRTAEIRFTTNGYCAVSAIPPLDIGRHLRSSASWISGIRLVLDAQAGLLGYAYTATFRADVYDGAVVRDGEVWVTAGGSGSEGGDGTSDRVTVQQARIEHAPTITSITCAQRDGSAIKDCAGGMNPLGQSPKFTATATDPNTADTLTYTWDKTGGTWHSTSGNVAHWIQPGRGQSGRYTITVTVSDGVDSTDDATTSMTIEVPSCTILVDGNSHVNPADGQSGFLAAEGTGRLSFRKGDHDACPIPEMANFATRPAADWITASGSGTLSDPVFTPLHRVHGGRKYHARCAHHLDRHPVP